MSTMTEHKTLTHALVAFQAELPDVSKGGTNPAFKSKYATLPDVTKAVFPILAKHGLAWVTMPDETEDGHVLRWELRHVSGESLAGVWPLPEGVKAQELGSWITYGRRYTLSAVTGITPDEDDDGNGAQSPVRARREPAADRVATALNAIAGAQSLDALASVWDRVKLGGIDGLAPLVKAHTERVAALQGTAEPSDPWAATPVAEVKP